jgi:hypothetical protein
LSRLLRSVRRRSQQTEAFQLHARWLDLHRIRPGLGNQASRLRRDNPKTAPKPGCRRTRIKWHNRIRAARIRWGNLNLAKCSRDNCNRRRTRRSRMIVKPPRTKSIRERERKARTQ